MIRAVILLTLAACASSKSAEQHAEVVAAARVVEHAEEQNTASGRTTAGPETITTTVEEWAAPVVDLAAVAPTADPTPFRCPQGVCSSVAPAVTATGRLVKRTVTVDQRGPVDSSWMANASGTQGAEQQTTLHAASEAHSASKTSYWPPVTYLLVGLLAAAAGLWLARGKIAPLLGIIGRIF